MSHSGKSIIYIPGAVLLFLTLFLIFGSAQGHELRSGSFIAAAVIICICAIVIFAGGIAEIGKSGKIKNKPLAKRISAAALCAIIATAAIFSVMHYKPEHIVDRNGEKLLARVDCFWDEQVHYYDYSGGLFYGKLRGYEYYGNGNEDPLKEKSDAKPLRWEFYDRNGNITEKNEQREQQTEAKSTDDLLNTKAEIKKLDVKTSENRAGELVFDISTDDFTESLNGYYWADNNTRLTLPHEFWQSFQLEGYVHTPYPVTKYLFTQDEKTWSLPTISVYEPIDNDDAIQQIVVDFDDHSYAQPLYDYYETLCFYTLKTIFPDMADGDITALYRKLNDLAYENFTLINYTSESVPCEIFYRDGIGLYAYFAQGECVHFCIVPVNDTFLTKYAALGSRITEIK